jgi:arylsulfatase A-like enzyme
MNRAPILPLLPAVVFASLAASAFPTASAAPAARPNILCIVTDDQDFATIGAYGGNVLTPNIDRLAEEGIRFTRAYCTSSSCSPSRYGLLTGRLASRCTARGFEAINPPGTQAYITNDAMELEPDRTNLARALREAGYRTGFVGKWHLGPGELSAIGAKRPPAGAKLGDPETDALLRENQKAMAAHLGSVGFEFARNIYWDNVGEHGLHVEGYDAQNMEWTVEGAFEFLDSQPGDRPFFLYFAPTQIHNPVGAIKKFAPLVGSERITPAGMLDHTPEVMPPRSTLATRLAEAGIPPEVPRKEAAVHGGTEAILWLDDGIGALLGRLETTGAAANTLVLFFSDNATWGKFHTYERGCRVPMIARWPARIPPGQISDALIANLDFAPTALAAAGIPCPADLGPDGFNQLPLLEGKGPSARPAAVLEFGNSRAASDGRWKYIALRPTDEDLAFEKEIGQPVGHWGAREGKARFLGAVLPWRKANLPLFPAYYDKDQLYDLAADPSEQRNLAADPESAATLRRMRSLLTETLVPVGRPFAEFAEGR